jgi:hypothetical protein
MPEAAENVDNVDLDEIETEEEEVEEVNEETVALAKSMGWVDEDKFRGDNSRWVNADKFVEKGMNDLPVLRERLRAQSKKLGEMESDIGDFKTHHEQSLAREYGRAMKELEEKQLATVEEGDTDAYQRIQAQKRDLATSHQRNAVPANKAPDNPLYVDWKEKSDWFEKKPGMTAFANVESDKIATDMPNLVGTPGFLEEVDRRVKGEFPEFFENSNRSNANAVESGGRSPRQRGSGRSYGDLPGDAKAACDKFVRRGLVTKEQYVKDYEWE